MRTTVAIRNVVLALILQCGVAAVSAQTFPSRPIRIIVPFPGGSVTDVFTRIIGENMVPSLGGQVVLTEPRPGAGTEIGTRFLMAQPPDGYAIMYATPSLAIKSAQLKPPFDARKDVAAIGQLGDSGLFLVVNTKHPFKTAKELVDYARANPGKLNMANYGVGTLSHLMGELLMYKTGAKAVSVAYNGASAMGVALGQGDGDFGFNVTSAVAAFVQQGKVRVLAASRETRDPTNPDIPSMTESGISGYNVTSWGGMAAPAGTPRDVILKLNAAINNSIHTPQVRGHFKNIGIGLVENISTPEVFTQTINTSVEEFSKVIRDANLVFD